MWPKLRPDLKRLSRSRAIDLFPFRALVCKVYQHQHHGCVRVVCGSGTRRVSSEIGGTIELSRDYVGRFGWDLRGKTARSALYLTVKVWWRAVVSPSTHDCVHMCSEFQSLFELTDSKPTKLAL